MKFGKRIAQWIQARNPEVYFNYAAFKKSLADDIRRGTGEAID